MLNWLGKISSQTLSSFWWSVKNPGEALASLRKSFMGLNAPGAAGGVGGVAGAAPGAADGAAGAAGAAGGESGAGGV